jgi:phasin family protein
LEQHFAEFQISPHQRRASNNPKPRFQRKGRGMSPRFELWRHEEMTDLDQQKAGEKSARRKDKKKRNKKAEPQQTLEQAQAVSEVVDAAMAEPIAPAVEVAPPDRTPAEPIQATASVARTESAPSEPVERVASFRERMATVVPPPANTAPAKPAAPAETAKAAPSPAAAPAAGLQAIANAYRDYTKKSLEDAQAFAEKLTAARSLDKAMEAQTEFVQKACETFAADSRKIRELHRELFWQTFGIPNWLPGRTQR